MSDPVRHANGTNGNGIRSPKFSRRSVSLQPLNGSSKLKPIRLRILIAGAEGTGKSCIIKRYCEKRFVSRYLPTIGIDYGATKIYADKREISVHIFDTSGSKMFSEVRNEFYRDTHGILLVFDLGKRETFDALCEWTKEIQSELARDGRDLDKTVVVVCANKCDQQKKQVDDIEARLWAELRGFPLFTTSAYSGEGINDMFHNFFSSIVRLHEQEGQLPRTPSSARKVQLSKSGSNSSIASNASQTGTIGRRRQSRGPENLTQAPILPQPSPEQMAVISRIRNGRDPWQQLGLVVGCTKEEVNKTYRKLAVMLHPDKTTVQGADEAFKTLGIARKNILAKMEM